MWVLLDITHNDFELHFQYKNGAENLKLYSGNVEWINQLALVIKRKKK